VDRVLVEVDVEFRERLERFVVEGRA
jgi:hypothetical protein